MSFDENEDILSSDETIEGTLTEESYLPAEIVPSRRGHPLENKSLVLEDEISQEKTYLCADGVTRVEPERSKLAFQKYLIMGAERSLAKLADMVVTEKPEGWENTFSTTSALRILTRYSSNFDWQNRIRLHVIEQSGRQVAAAQRKAASSKHERIRRSKKLQEVAEKIFDRAQILGEGVEEMTAQEARQLLKPATTMMQIGLAAERAEIGESLAKITPPKPVDTMTEEELDAWIAVLRENL